MVSFNITIKDKDGHAETVTIPVPDDLTVDIRQQHIYLSSGDRTVDLDNSGRFGPFRDGPIAWTRLVYAYIAPALDQLRPAQATASVLVDPADGVGTT